MWADLSKPWQESFKQAWSSYCKGSFPIGAVVVDKKDQIIAKGRNKVYEKEIEFGQISNNKIAHAEINAILMLNTHDRDEVKNYTLYSTMEPCPLCFGATIMSGIKEIKFAARDRVAGATGLNQGNDYIASKALNIEGPDLELEFVQIVLKTDFILRRGLFVERLLNAWKLDCPHGIDLGLHWFKENKFCQAKNEGKDFAIVADEILKDKIYRLAK